MGSARSKPAKVRGRHALAGDVRRMGGFVFGYEAEKAIRPIEESI
jgi:hypothetical protein